jgi:hypothetical protein
MNPYKINQDVLDDFREALNNPPQVAKNIIKWITDEESFYKKWSDYHKKLQEKNNAKTK